MIVGFNGSPIMTARVEPRADKTAADQKRKSHEIMEKTRRAAFLSVMTSVYLLCIMSLFIQAERAFCSEYELVKIII